MKKIYAFYVIMFVLLISTNIYSLKILEPLTKDLTTSNTVDLGYFSAGEFFMISFLLENNESYNSIQVDQTQIKDVIIESTKKTQESIFTMVKLDESLDGEYLLKLILSSDVEKKEIFIKMNITNEVIHTNLINYNPEVRFEKIEQINLNIINKSNTTKKVKISSDLPKKWFNKNKEYLEKEKQIILLPNSTTEVVYQYYPKEIGEKQFNLKINSFTEIENSKEYINYNLTINTKKEFSSIYGSKEHTYPLFNSNLIPLYFFNKIIKLI